MSVHKHTHSHRGKKSEMLRRVFWLFNKLLQLLVEKCGCGNATSWKWGKRDRDRDRQRYRDRGRETERQRGNRWTEEDHASEFKESLYKRLSAAGQWWHTPLIPALGRQRQVDFEFEASLDYRVSTRTARATERNAVSKNKNKQTKKENYTFWSCFLFLFF